MYKFVTVNISHTFMYFTVLFNSSILTLPVTSTQARIFVLYYKFLLDTINFIKENV